VKRFALADTLPDYKLKYDASADQVMFYTKDAKCLAQGLSET